MSLLITAGVVLLALGLLFLATRRDVTLCVLEIEEGQLSIRSGGLSQSVVRDLDDVVRRRRIRRGTLRVVRNKDRARLEASSDVTKADTQVLRNVVGTQSLAKLSAGVSKNEHAKNRRHPRA